MGSTRHPDAGPESRVDAGLRDRAVTTGPPQQAADANPWRDRVLDVTTVDRADDRTGPPSDQRADQRRDPGAAARTGPDPRSGQRVVELAELGPVDSRSRQVVMVVELHDAPLRRHGEDPVWHDTFSAAIVDTHDVVEAYGGSMVAVLGSRIVAAFPVARVIDAFEAAVTIQRRTAHLVDGVAAWLCSIGLATGDAIDNTALDGLGVPVVSSVIDRALLLCSWAQAGAVVADERTVVPALLFDTESSEAAAPNPGASSKTWSLGASRVLVGHGDDTLEYWDLVFDRSIDADPPRLRAYRARRPCCAPGTEITQRSDESNTPGYPDYPGSKATPGSAMVSSSSSAVESASFLLERSRTNRRERADSSLPSAKRQRAAARQTWSYGRVWCWFSDRGRGVITSSTGQEFYVDRRFLVVHAELPADTPVYFVPRDPMARGRNPVAAVVLVEGSRLEVRIEHVDDRGFGFSELSDSNGTRQLLLLDLSALASEVGVGDWLLVQVNAGDHGPVGVPV